MAMGISELPAVAITFVVVGVVVAIGLAIQSDVQEDISADYGNDSEAYTATQDAIEGTAELADKLPLIGLVVGFAIVLGVISGFLYQRYA